MAKINSLIMIKKQKSNDIETARKDAGKLLSKRMHSTTELKNKLLKKYHPDIINKLIDELQKLDFINDERFAKAYADELQNKGFGRNLILSKLRKRGLNPENIKDILPANPEFQEEEMAESFIKTKMTQILRENDPYKRKIKFIRALLNRGFSLETAQKLSEKLLKIPSV